MALGLVAAFLAGCATTGKRASFTLDDEWDAYDDSPLINDPFEGYNRFIFNVNDKIYKFIFNPIANVYDFLVPKKVQGSVNNFVQATGTPKRFFNNLFQGKPKGALTEFGRLLINATLGIGGLFDPADRVFGLKQQGEDFGQTLGHYGVGRSLVLERVLLMGAAEGSVLEEIAGHVPVRFRHEAGDLPVAVDDE